MEHEVFVPVPAERLREALADPERVARAVPGLQQDVGTAPVAGRLRVRVGGHTITYRGVLRVTGQDDGSYAVEGDATEARGSGSVKLALAVRLLPAEGGTTVAFGGTATGDGRVAELPGDAVAAAGTRLLSRFAENLAAASGGEAEPSAEPAPEPSRAPESPAEPEPELEPEPPTVFETEVPPPALAADEDIADDDLADADDDELVAEDFVDVGAGAGVDNAEPPAEAAHARRTMIGRSAEEVDHAPPRGRYAPVPAPEITGAGATLRWAAPAAALVLASAIVVTRVLRRRR